MLKVTFSSFSSDYFLLPINGYFAVCRACSYCMVSTAFPYDIATSINFNKFKLGYAISIHKSQGSEFDVIVLPVVKGYNKMLYRKLYYTAITRAKKRLWLVNALSRTIYGNKVSNKESRFIKEIDSKYFNIKTSNVKVNNVDDSIEYKVGEHIYFDTYGEGVIVGIKDKILTVAFKHPYGIKMLIKGHKKIRKV